MIAIGSGTRIGMYCGVLDTPVARQVGKYINERIILKDPTKLAFKKYWKRIINTIHPYKNKCKTGIYVFIWPIIHICVLSVLY